MVHDESSVLRSGSSGEDMADKMVYEAEKKSGGGQAVEGVSTRQAEEHA